MGRRFVAELSERLARRVYSLLCATSAVRNEVRKQIGSFVEVYVKCPLDVLAERDVKGLYKKAMAGEIKNFTGVDDPYEEPFTAEIMVETDRESPEESLARIVAKLEEM